MPGRVESPTLGLSPLQTVRLAMSEALLGYVGIGERAAEYGRWPPVDTDVADYGNQAEILLENLTRLRCGAASLFTLLALWKESAEQFSTMAVLSSIAVTDPRTHFHNHNNPRYTNHAVFLLKDCRDYWYLGSPANYQVGGKTNPISRVYHNWDLETLLAKLTRAVGGLWPTAEFIAENMDQKRLFPYLEGCYLVCPMINRAGDNQELGYVKAFKLQQPKDRN